VALVLQQTDPFFSRVIDMGSVVDAEGDAATAAALRQIDPTLFNGFPTTFPSLWDA
jgi:hypothetical protein